MPKGFTKGDPRAVAAGRKGGQTMRSKQSPDYKTGYGSGWRAGVRRGVELAGQHELTDQANQKRTKESA